MTKLQRSSPIDFEIDGASYLVPAATRDQVRRCLALDPTEGSKETAAQIDTRRSQQVSILTEGCPSFPLGHLTPEMEIEILTAIISRHHGMDPNDMVGLHRALKKKAALLQIAARLSTANPSSSLRLFESPSLAPSPSRISTLWRSLTSCFASAKRKHTSLPPSTGGN